MGEFWYLKIFSLVWQINEIILNLHNCINFEKKIIIDFFYILRTWKELCKACVEAQEFRLAAVAGMNIIIHPDHLEELIKHYEEWGF